MSKSPEEYFQDQNFAPAAQGGGASFSEAELAFMRKYMGLDAQETLDKIGIKATDVPLREDTDASAPAEEAGVEGAIAAAPAGEPETPAREEILQPEAGIAPEPQAEAQPTDDSVIAAVEPEAEQPAVEPPVQPAAEAPAQPEETITFASAPMPDSLGLSGAAQALSAAASALSEAASALSGVRAVSQAGARPEESELEASIADENESEFEIIRMPEDGAEIAADEIVEAEPELALEAVADGDIEPAEDALGEEVAQDAASGSEPEPEFAAPESEPAEFASETVVPEPQPESAAAEAEAPASEEMPAEEQVEEAAVAAAPVEPESAVAAAPDVREVPAVAAPVAETPAAVYPAPAATAQGVSSDDAETFKETVDQQLMCIKAALDGLKDDGSEKSLADALYRSITTIQNSSSYMGLEEIKVYAERTAGIVDQGRKTNMDFGILVDLLEQECGIIEDMLVKAISDLRSGALAPQAAPAAEVAPAPPAAPEPAPPAPEAAVRPAPVSGATPAAVASPAESIVESASESAPGPEPASAPEPAPLRPAYVDEPPSDLYSEMAEEESLDVILRREAELQMVGFYLGKQEFTVPTLTVQEVIRYETPAKMPAAPEFVAGVINLRGKMTPLVHLRDMLEIRQPRESEDRFIIVCRRKGLQIGLLIERVHTMYRVPQADIDWGIESLLGINNAEFLSGLLKLNDSLVGVVSVDRIIEHVLD